MRMLALSGGETRRVDLACTLMGDPELVILDEPTTGLDPESRREVWRLVSDLRDGGATVLITTHYLEEAEALADRLEIMHAGRIVRSGTPTEIAAGHPSTITFADVPDVPGDLAGIRRVVREHGRTTLETDALQTLAVRPAGLGRPQRRRARRSRRSQPEPRDRVPLDRRRPRPGRSSSRASPDRPEQEPSDDHACRSSLAPADREPDALERGPALPQPARVRLRRGAAAAAARAAVHRRARRPVGRRGRHRHHVPRHRAVPRLLQRARPVREPPRRARPQAHAHRRVTRRRVARQHRAARRDHRAGPERGRHPDRRRRSTSRCR